MSIFKKNVKNRSITNLVESAKDLAKRNPAAGLDGTGLVESLPLYNRADGEKVFKNKNNAWIVLGRDRPSGKPSGYGGAGNDKCGSIDLVVGRMANSEAGQKSNLFVDPSMAGDAARIYISQKTDIDKNFNLAEGSVGLSVGRSAIGIKADSIRIVARQGIKIISSMPEDISTARGEGGPKSIYGIDLLSGNSDEEGFLQPIPKGDNLQEALNEMVDAIEDTNKILNNFMTKQMQWNTQVAVHVHEAFPIPIPPSPSLGAFYAQIMPSQLINGKIPASWSNRVNFTVLKNNFLKAGSAKWINSKLNRTT